MQEDSRCETCKCYYQDDTIHRMELEGECRYYPPAVTGKTDQMCSSAAFPLVPFYYWCSRYEHGKQRKNDTR